MDPRGEFVEAFGKDSTAENVADRLEEELGLWEGYDFASGVHGGGPKRLEEREYQPRS